LFDVPLTLNQLCPTHRPYAAQSNVLCGAVEDFAMVEVVYILTTCPHFDNVEIDIFDAGGPQCHVITSVTNAVGILTLSVY